VLDVSTTIEQEALNQVMFREVNERIAELNARWHEAGIGLFICECSDSDCAESVNMTLDEYEHVRSEGAHFAVLPGHQIAEVERVVGGNGRFLIVEKFGEAATIARSGDPRRHD